MSSQIPFFRPKRIFGIIIGIVISFVIFSFVAIGGMDIDCSKLYSTYSSFIEHCVKMQNENKWWHLPFFSILGLITGYLLVWYFYHDNYDKQEKSSNES